MITRGEPIQVSKNTLRHISLHYVVFDNCLLFLTVGAVYFYGVPALPSGAPSGAPSVLPSSAPSGLPSGEPSGRPSAIPTIA